MLKLKHHYYDEKIGNVSVFMGNLYDISTGEPCVVIQSEKTGEEKRISELLFRIMERIGDIKRRKAV